MNVRGSAEQNPMMRRERHTMQDKPQPQHGDATGGGRSLTQSTGERQHGAAQIDHLYTRLFIWVSKKVCKHLISVKQTNISMHHIILNAGSQIYARG